MSETELLDIRFDGYALEEDLSAVRHQWPLLGIYRTAAGELSFHVSLRGIRGGKNKEHRLDTVDYLVEIRLRDFPQRSPQAWIKEPPLDTLQHCNVFTNGMVCISTGATWQKLWENDRLPDGQMSIVGYLLQVNYTLKNENPESPAR